MIGYLGGHTSVIAFKVVNARDSSLFFFLFASHFFFSFLFAFFPCLPFPSLPFLLNPFLLFSLRLFYSFLSTRRSLSFTLSITLSFLSISHSFTLYPTRVHVYSFTLVPALSLYFNRSFSVALFGCPSVT